VFVLIDNVLRSLRVGRDSQMPDWLVLITTLGGFAVFGMHGFVTGPVMAATFMTVWQLAVLAPNTEPKTACRRGMSRNKPAPHPPANAPTHLIAASGLDDRRDVAALRCAPQNRLRPSPCPTLPRVHEISPCTAREGSIWTRLRRATSHAQNPLQSTNIATNIRRQAGRASVTQRALARGRRISQPDAEQPVPRHTGGWTSGRHLSRLGV
jgi:hypothetical protein